MYKSILNGWSHSKPKLQLAAEGAREYYLQVEKKENIVGDSEGETQELELGIVDDGWRGVSSIFFLLLLLLFKHIPHCLPQKHQGLSRGLTIIQ